MRCPRCEHEGPAGARFCPGCGAKLAAHCPACEAEVPEGARFCPGCGATLTAAPTPGAYTPRHLAEKILTSRGALQGERKPVTVLFCDLVSSTALAERLGPDAMHELLNRFFALALAEVHRYEGTLNQFLGDGFMALFGAPIAHEDHARRAALAALGIRRALEATPLVADVDAALPLRVRMGLNTGLVVVGAIGDNLRMDYTAVGDTTHLAARLQQLAEPGEILVSEATARLVEGYVALAPRGEIPVRGLRRPQVVHRLTGPGSRRSRLEVGATRGLSRFVGRDRELATLEEAVERVMQGRGQAVGVVGEAGLGKSRLLLELHRRCAERNVAWLEGRCLSYGSTIPYLPILDLVRAACGLADLDAPEIGRARLQARLGSLGMEVADREPYLAHLLGLKDEDDVRLATLGADVIMERTFDALRQLLVRIAREGPIVVAIEDLHWIDRTSERFLGSLAEGLGRAAILLVVTYRPGYRPPWLDRSYAAQLALGPLAVEESQTVLRSTLSTLDEASLRPILERAEGNPFFLEELARAVADPEAPGQAGLPGTVQGVLAARIDRLPEVTKRVLQTASVLGREFPTRLLAALWEEATPLGPHLRELARLEFLSERTDLEEDTYVFRHALTQEVTETTLVAPQRRALHQRAARALQEIFPERTRELAAVLVHHCLAAEAWAEAADHARRAAEAARAAYANQEARAHYDQALAAAERAGLGVAERRALLEARAGIHEILGAFDPARADLEAAGSLAESAGDVVAQARVLGSLAALWGGHQDYERGRELAQQAVALLDGAADQGARAEAHARLGIMLLNVGRVGESREELERALELWQRMGDRLGEARAHEMLAMNLGLSGGLHRARLHGERAARDLAGSGLHANEVGALLAVGVWRTIEEGLGAGDAHFRRGLEVARQAGLRASEAFAHGLRAEIMVPFGAWARAHAEATACLEIAQAIAHREWSVLSLGVLGSLHHGCGDAAGARRLHERMLAVARELRNVLWIAGALQFVGQDLLLAGDVEGAVARFTECLAVGGEVVKDVARAHLGLAEVALGRDRPEEALDLVRRYEETGDYQVFLPDAGRLRALALAQLGRRAEAGEILHRAVDFALGLGVAPGAWRARLALARLLDDTGHHAEARRQAAEACSALEAVARDLPDPVLRQSLERSVLAEARDLARAPGS